MTLFWNDFKKFCEGKIASFCFMYMDIRHLGISFSPDKINCFLKEP